MTCERCQSRPAIVAGLCQACLVEVQGFRGFFNDPFFGDHQHGGFETPEPRAEKINILDAFSDRAKKVMQEAAESTVKHGSPVMDTEHLLIGVARDDEVGQQILRNLDVDAEELTGYLEENMVKGEKEYEEDAVPDLSPRAKQALELSWHAARNLQHDYVGSEHILLGLLEEGEGLAAQTLNKYGISETKLRQAVLSAVGEKGKKTGEAKKKSKTPTLDKYSRDLSEMAEGNKLDPVIGRSEEVQRVVQILSRRTKNNPVLVGEPGVGKTAIAEGLATKIVNKDVPETLEGKRVLSLDIGALVAGTKFRGEFEERLTKIIEEVRENKEGLVLFIDELHTVLGAGGGGEGGTLDAANILKPALARGDLHVIGATTLDEYKKHIEKDGALERRFQMVPVDEPSVADSMSILRGLKDRYEAHHKVTITDEAIVAAVSLTDRYVSDRFLPDKAIDVIDEAASKVRLAAIEEPKEVERLEKKIKDLDREISASDKAGSKDKIRDLKNERESLSEELKSKQEAHKKESATAQAEVKSSDVEAIVAAWTKIPVEKMSEAEAERLLSMEDELHKRVIAQEEAVKAVSEAIRRNRAGLKDPKRPQGSFLFLGPTGVGKTELTRALAEVVFGSEEAMIRLDMSEYMEKHAVARMIGSPPGYVGHEEGGQLTEAVRRQAYSVILLDEIEKAHPEVFNLLLQILEDGRLTDSKGRVVDFKNTMIVMTSNLPEDEVKKAFRPEFINRIDDIIVFHALEKKHVQEIADILLADVQKRVEAQGINLVVNEDVRNRLAQDGFDPEYGARPLRREITQRLENRLATALLSNKFGKGESIEAYLKGDDIAFKKVKS